MYTAVRIVKMNACRKLDQDLEAVIATSSANENGRMTTVTFAPEDRGADHRERHEDEVAGEHVGEESDHQRERPHEEVETNSMITTSGRIAFGTPGGTTEFLR